MENIKKLLELTFEAKILAKKELDKGLCYHKQEDYIELCGINSGLIVIIEKLESILDEKLK